MFATRPPLDSGPLIGTRVHLLPLRVSHAEALLRAATEARETYALTFVPGDLAAMKRWVEVAVAAAESGAAVPFATYDAVRERIVGSTRFANLEVLTTPVAGQADVLPAAVEIGWTWLAASAQRTSINTEAKLLMLTHAFETWGLRRVFLKTHEKNVRSRNAIERLGATPDGILRTHLPDGATRQTAFYSLRAEEWPAARERLQARLAR